MNTTTALKTAPFILAAAFPVALAAQALGCPLPATVDATHMFGVFVIALTLQLLFADYRTTKPLTVCSNPSHVRSTLPLAA